MTRPVEDLLPHRPPFLWVDEILDVEPGVRCVAIKRLDGSEPVFTGHFPGNPILPGVLLIEAAAQTGVLMLGAGRPERPGVMLLAAVTHFKFQQPVRPGDVIEIETRVLTEAMGMAVVSAVVRVGTSVVASGQLSLAERQTL